MCPDVAIRISKVSEAEPCVGGFHVGSK
jgi:hypothetical protein